VSTESSPPIAGQFFRAGVGIVVTDASGRVLALERADRPGAWQFPQGGLEATEEPRDAALRELREETGLSPGDLELVDELDEWLVYELPPADRSPKTGRGQVQRWLKFAAPADGDELEYRPGIEARRLRWMPFPELLEGVVDFRRETYERIGRRFALTGGPAVRQPEES
jgi:putative (di)nucleoside polyphosphate hydrolase